MTTKLKLHILLAEKRLTQKEVSQATGIRANTISSYCNDTAKHIVKEHINILCDFFDCNVCDLIEYTPNKKD